MSRKIFYYPNVSESEVGSLKSKVVHKRREICVAEGFSKESVKNENYELIIEQLGTSGNNNGKQFAKWDNLFVS